MEKWVDIIGYEGIYEVSDMGRVRSSKHKTTESERHGTRKWKQRILKQKISRDNNCRVDLWKRKQPQTFLVHRLVARAFIISVDGKDYVNHIDGNRLNNKVDNLEWCDHKENNNHALENGLMSANNFIVLEDLTNGELHRFTSYVKASEFLGRSHNFVSSAIKKGEHIIDHYIIYTTKSENLARVEYINDRLK